MFNVSMKKTLIASTLALSIASGSMWASASAAPSILIDSDQSVTVEINPVVNKGITLVEARPLLERLGFTVKWNESKKALTASNDKQTMVIQPDTAKVVVNGTTHKMAAPAAKVKGQLYVPLRSVSELAGHKVKVNNKHTYTIYDPKVIEQEQQQLAQVEQFFATMAKHENSGDSAAFLAMFDKQSRFYPHMETQVNKGSHTMQKTSYKNISIADISSQGMSVNATIVSTIYSGNQATATTNIPASFLIKYDSKKQVPESVISVLPVGIEYTLEEGWKTAKTDLPEADRQALKQLADTMIEVVNTENLDKVQDVFTADSPAEAATLAGFNMLFPHYDIKAELKDFVIIGAAKDQAYFVTVEQYRKIKGPEFPDNEVTQLYSLERAADGKWKISGITVMATNMIGGES